MVKEELIIKDVIDLIHSKKKMYTDDKSPIEVYAEHKHPNLKTKKGLKILLLNAPCNGFGDVVFAMKLRDYLKEWYPYFDVKIASTKVDNFKSLGEKEENLYHLKGGKSDQCRRFRNLSFVDNQGRDIAPPEADLIFVAPVQMDFDPNYSDVKAVLPYANYLNTFTFSEYNDSLDKGFDFNTGVGDERDGMLFTKIKKDVKRLPKLKNKYAVVYIAQTVRGADTCFINFAEMVSKKYSKNIKFDIVVPSWIIEEILDTSLGKRLIKKVGKYFARVDLVKKDGKKETIYEDDSGSNVLTLRGDILPLPYKEMGRLFLKSVKEILVTGDQSITDVLACCWKDKLPMYQIVPWKKDFSKELAKHLPQKFLKYIRTSCGTAKAISYNPSFKKFVERWDFRKLAKKKIDGIVSYTLDKKESEKLREMEKIFLSSKSKNKLIERLENLL